MTLQKLVKAVAVVAWRRVLAWLAALAIVGWVGPVQAQAVASVADIPSRAGVTVRTLLLAPAQPRAAVLLLAGGHGGLQLTADGGIGWGSGNFLVRTRQLFADQGLLTLVLDAPSDRQVPPFLDAFRQTPDHVTDLQAAMAWVRRQHPGLPVWLVGTSRGTLSAAHAATQLQGTDAPDGVVLTSSILRDRRGTPVTAMPLDQIRVPVLVVHHKQDDCQACPFDDTAVVMRRLGQSPRSQLLAIEGGISQGPACEARAHHGYNGQEADVVAQIARWILTP